MKGTSYGIRDTVDRRSDQWRSRRQYRWSIAEEIQPRTCRQHHRWLIAGGVGEQILSATGLLSSGGGGLVGNIGGSAVGGAILMAIVGAIKNAMANKA